MNNVISLSTTWDSEIQGDVKYSMTLDRKLIDTTGYYNYQEQQIPTINFQAHEVIKSYQNGQVFQEMKTEISFTYGLNIGIIAWSIRTVDNFITFKLKAIYTEEEFNQLILQSNIFIQ